MHLQIIGQQITGKFRSAFQVIE